MAKAAVVKVAVGPASGTRVARFIRAGATIPDGVEPDLLDALAKRGLIELVKPETKQTAAAKAKADAAAADKAVADAAVQSDADAVAKAVVDKATAK